MSWSKKQISVLLTVSVTSFMGTFLVSGINIALPSIENSFSLKAIELSWIITVFILATAMFLLPVGKWGDTYGNSKFYKAGLFIFTLSSFLCAIAPNATWLIAARFLQGVGSAFSNTTGQAILVSQFPSKNRGQVLGISVSSVYIGLALGPFLGGIIVQQFGWQILFYIAAVLGIMATIVAFIFLEDDKKEIRGKSKTNAIDTLIFMSGLVLMTYGSSQIPTIFGWSMLISGVILLVIFYFLETKIEKPMLDTNLFTHNKLFAYSNLAALINYTATFAIVFFLSLYLQDVRDMSPQMTGSIIIAQPIMMTILSPITGKLSDKIQPRYLSTLGMSICTVGLASLAFLNETTPIWIIIAILVWVGIGFAFFSSPNMSTIMSSVVKSRYGQASGIASSMRVFGQIVGMTIVTLFFASLFGNKAVIEVDNALFLTAMRRGFITFALISLVGIYFSFTRGNVKR
ncbi:MAG: MFS transporter [Dysgonamonadaceae bacterium]